MLIRSDPFADLQRLTRQLVQRSTPPTLAMDAYRDDDAVVVEFDAPGIEPDGVEVTVERDMLTVVAHRCPDRHPGPRSGPWGG